MSHWDELLPALAAGLLRHHAAPGPELEQKQPTAPARVGRSPVGANLFSTLEQEVAALLATDLGRAGSSAAQPSPSTSGLTNRDATASTIPSPADVTTPAAGAAGLALAADDPPALALGDAATRLTRAAAVAGSGASGTPAPPPAGPPPSPTIPPRPRTTGPSRPARAPGSLSFAGTAGALDTASCDTNWTTYGEANVVGNTITLGVPDRPETNLDQLSDVHGASLLLPPAAQYTFTFTVNLSSWDTYTPYQGNGTGYWDAFSVSLTSAPYPSLNWNDPVSLPFAWGGQRAGDGHLDTNTGTVTITVTGDPNGSNYLNVVLDTFSQPDADNRYPSWGTVSITDGVPGVSSIALLPTGQGTTGDLSNDNPDGDGIVQPAFKGGYRFFPDAVNYATRTQSRNIVRIRAVVAPAGAGAPVYFRSFDVDDPSADTTLDPNGNDGKDNRGTVAGANLDAPALAPANAGYRGRLRPVGGNFAVEGATVAVNTDGQGKAEVELATSFNPGDNFRVVASCNQQEVQNLNDTTNVPTSGPIANFTGKATDQLSVWRRVHIEEDKMAAIPFGRRATAQITGVVPIGFPVVARAMVTVNFQIQGANSYVGGSLRDMDGRRYHIISHDTANPSTLTVQCPLGIAPVLGSVTITQGDFQIGDSTLLFIPAGGQLEFTTNINISDVDEYEGGVLRTGGVNYRILGNTNGNNAHVTIEAPGELPLGRIEIDQDDFIAEPLSTAPPAPRINPPADTNFYDMLQVSTVRALNRFADAYLEAEYNALNAFDSNDVTPASHSPTFSGQDLLDLANPYRGTSPGGAPRPADYETDVFWTVYVLAGYEPAYEQDNDPPTEGAVLGATEDEKNQVSIVFVEAIRDATTTNPVLTDAQARARTTVHEIGHQFDIAHGDPPVVVGEHRDPPRNPLNIMSSNTSAVPDNQFYLHPADIAFLRMRVHSPGS